MTLKQLSFCMTQAAILAVFFVQLVTTPCSLSTMATILFFYYSLKKYLQQQHDSVDLKVPCLLKNNILVNISDIGLPQLLCHLYSREKSIFSSSHPEYVLLNYGINLFFLIECFTFSLLNKTNVLCSLIFSLQISLKGILLVCKFNDVTH